MDQAYSEAVAATDDAPISPSADAVLISTDSKEAGLWLWQGEAPPPISPSPPRAKSRNQQILRRIMPAAGWAGWIALPTGVALTLIAVSTMRHPDRSVSADTPAVALGSAPSPAVIPSFAPPPVVAPSSALSPTAARPVVDVPAATPTTAQLHQEQVTSAPAAEIMTRTPEPRMAKWRAQRKSPRTGRKIHVLRIRREPLFPRPGVLTPPPVTWHGGGY